MNKLSLSDELYRLVVFLDESANGLTALAHTHYGSACKLLKGHEDLPGAAQLLESYANAKEKARP